MGIDNISNKKITRDMVLSIQEIPENDRRELLTIFDSIDSEEKDNQLDVITEEEAITAFVDMVKEYLAKSFDKILEKLKINKNDIESIAYTPDWVDLTDAGKGWNMVGINIIRASNKYLSDAFPSNLHKEVFNKIIEKIDDGDGLAQENEYILVKRLLNIANSLVEDPDGKLDETHFSLKGLNLLLQKIEDGEIDIEKLKEDIKKEQSVEYRYPHSENITESLEFEPLSAYKIKVFKTNSTKKYDGVGDNKSLLEYDTYVISFINPDTGETQNLNIHIDKQIEEEKSLKEILASVCECNDNIVDLMLNEINDIYITSKNNNTKKYGGKNSQDGYERMSKSHRAGAYYQKYNECLNIYYDGKHFYNFDSLPHELGHAKDNDSITKYELYELIEKDNVKSSEYLRANPDEMYAEFFQDYHDTQEIVLLDIDEKYGDIADKMPAEALEKFIEEITVSFLTNQDMTISSILDRAGLGEYKELFREKLNEEFKLNYKPYHARHDKKIMEKLAKNNPKITELHIKLMHEIAYDYNHPQENVHKRFKK